MDWKNIAYIAAGLFIIVYAYLRYRFPYSKLTEVMRRSYTDISVEVFVERNLAADAFLGLGLVIAGALKGTMQMIGWALMLVGAVWMLINMTILHRREQL